MLSFYIALIADDASAQKFELLYREYRHTMLWVAKSILHDHALAEDAVHEAFLKVLNHMEKIFPENCNETRAFVVIIVKNLSLDMLRKQKRQAEVDFGEWEPFLQDDQINPEEQLLKNERIDVLVSALKKVKPSYTDVLTLSLVYEYSNQDIAQLLNITPENVRVRLYRGRMQLVQHLKDDDRIDVEHRSKT
jgi:RNA polymerase sigma-70 factor, ECF subfamily